MADDLEDLDKLVLTRLVRLNATLQGIITGLILGLGLFFATIWLVLKGGNVVGPHLSLLGQFFIGYRVSLLGSFIGLAYGFGGGFMIGYGVTSMYNYIVERRERKRFSSHR